MTDLLIYFDKHFQIEVKTQKEACHQGKHILSHYDRSSPTFDFDSMIHVKRFGHLKTRI